MILAFLLDWASSKHDVCIHYADGTRELAVVKLSAEAIEQWITKLHQLHPGQIAIALELSKGPIVYALQKYPFVTLFPIKPTMLCLYRRALSPSGAKDDPTDASIALELLVRYPDKITPLLAFRTTKPVLHLAYFLLRHINRLVRVLLAPPPLLFVHCAYSAQ